VSPTNMCTHPQHRNTKTRGVSAHAGKGMTRSGRKGGGSRPGASRGRGLGQRRTRLRQLCVVCFVFMLRPVGGLGAAAQATQADASSTLSALFLASTLYSGRARKE